MSCLVFAIRWRGCALALILSALGSAPCATARALLPRGAASFLGNVQQQVPGIIRVPLRRLERLQAPPSPPADQVAGRSLLQVHTKDGTMEASRVKELNPDQELSLLQAASASADVSGANGAPPVDIFGQITVGTPPETFSVAIDTGSSNLLLTSSRCRSIGCLAHKMYVADESNTTQKVSLTSEGTSLAETDADGTVFLAISTGEAQGELRSDMVCLGTEGDVCARSSFVSMTKMSQEPFNTFPYDGILGVGMPGGSLDKSFNFLGNLAEAGLMKRNRFAVWLRTEEDTSDSEITFGDFLEERLGSEILWLRTSRADSGVWQTTLSDVALNNAKLGSCGSDGCQAAFDTGTSAIAGTDSFITGILTQLNVQEDCSNYDTLPNLGFQFRMYILNIEKQDYVKKAGGKCYHQFLKVDIPPPKGPLVLLGDPFMRRYFTIFDRDSLKIGVAFATHEGVAGSTETSSQAALRLMHMTQ